MLKAVALIDGGLLSPSFKRRRMGHFQMCHQSWCSDCLLCSMPALSDCSPRMVPVPLCSGSPQQDKAKVTGSSKGIFKPARERKISLRDEGPRRDSATSIFGSIQIQPGKGSEKPGVR